MAFKRGLETPNYPHHGPPPTSALPFDSKQLPLSKPVAERSEAGKDLTAQAHAAPIRGRRCPREGAGRLASAGRNAGGKAAAARVACRQCAGTLVPRDRHVPRDPDGPRRAGRRGVERGADDYAGPLLHDAAVRAAVAGTSREARSNGRNRTRRKPALPAQAQRADPAGRGLRGPGVLPLRPRPAVRGSIALALGLGGRYLLGITVRGVLGWWSRHTGLKSPAWWVDFKAFGTLVIVLAAVGLQLAGVQQVHGWDASRLQDFSLGLVLYYFGSR